MTEGLELRSAGRLPALDWMRGVVMAIMALDHAGAIFDAGHLANDSAVSYTPGTALPIWNFLTRWITHLCAPTFLFLAGTSMALSLEKRKEQIEWEIDRHVLARGAFIAALDPTLVTLTWYWFYPVPIYMQVLFAIGVSMICMVPLRRLPNTSLLALGLLILSCGEWVALAYWDGTTWNAPVGVALLLGVGFYGNWIVTYPVLPWLAMMILGWLFGRHLARSGTSRAEPARQLAIYGILSLAGFVIVRGLNGYGNMRLFREDHSLVQWLHVSKYPPSLSFVLLTLGLLALCLAACFVCQNRGTRPLWSGNPLLVFGQTALFFYLLHVPLLILLSKLTGLGGSSGLTVTYLATLAVLAALYPPCLLYRRYKTTRPDGWSRFL